MKHYWIRGHFPMVHAEDKWSAVELFLVWAQANPECIVAEENFEASLDGDCDTDPNSCSFSVE